jgi:uncharacterized protein YdhG (YjbR/CyaY superfamily)
MTNLKPTAQSIDEYIARFPDEIQAVLQQLRTTIHEAAPEATETISYQMPAFAQEGVLVYFAAWKQHIGLYPPISDDAECKAEVAVYEGPKGNLQFPLDQPLPLDLIRKIVQFRVQENRARAAAKRKPS